MATIEDKTTTELDLSVFHDGHKERIVSLPKLHAFWLPGLRKAINPMGYIVSICIFPCRNTQGGVLIKGVMKMGLLNSIAWPTNWNHDRFDEPDVYFIEGKQCL